MKIKLFSHTDLDGYGCNYVLKRVYKDADIDCTNLSYDKVEHEIFNFFNSGEYRDYDVLFITDLSISKEVAECIDKYTNELKVCYIDHHKTSLYANKYGWATINETIKVTTADGEKERKTSATEILYLLHKLCFDNKLYEFIRDVTLYDTWLWTQNEEFGIEAYNLNNLLYLLGPDNFLKELDKADDVNEMLENNSVLIEFRERDIKDYIDKKAKEIIPYEISGYNAGVVFAEQYISQLGNELAKRFPEYDLIVMINGKSVSYRTAKQNVDCSKIAELYGGGGHPASSGSQIRHEDNLLYLNEIFNR